MHFSGDDIETGLKNSYTLCSVEWWPLNERELLAVVTRDEYGKKRIDLTKLKNLPIDDFAAKKKLIANIAEGALNAGMMSEEDIAKLSSRKLQLSVYRAPDSNWLNVKIKEPKQQRHAHYGSMNNGEGVLRAGEDSDEVASIMRGVKRGRFASDSKDRPARSAGDLADMTGWARAPNKGEEPSLFDRCSGGRNNGKGGWRGH